MREDLQDLLNAVEKKRDQLYKMASCMELTSEEVVKFSCELDKLLNEVYILSNRKQPNSELVQLKLNTKTS
ncbi:MAG: Spo0E family sporulation regulatory protein-aspartic acid phosphatase [Desulfitobacteriaceae bacterium]